MNEEWRQVTGCEGYEVSNLGRVRSWRRPGRTQQRFAIVPKILKHNTHPDGYQQVSISIDGNVEVRYVHHLVLVGPCPEGLVTRHLDSEPRNNRLDNIKWDTQAENWQDQRRRGTDTRAHRNSRAKFTAEQIIDIRRRLINGEGGSDLARELDVSPATISRIKHRVHYAA